MGCSIEAAAVVSCANCGSGFCAGLAGTSTDAERVSSTSARGKSMGMGMVTLLATRGAGGLSEKREAGPGP